jgi:hypothetical protein
LPQKVVDRALARDAVAARAEYLAEFRTDVSGFIERALLEMAVDRDVKSRLPWSGVTYKAFCDAASGVGGPNGDRFTCAIGHIESDIAIIDHVFEKRPPFDASATVAEIAGLLRTYRITEVIGDAYSIGFLKSEFSRHGITYHPSELDRSELYLHSLPIFTSGRVRLTDNQTVVEQLAALERRPGANGKDRVDHRAGSHDDSSNATAGVIAALTVRTSADHWLQYMAEENVRLRDRKDQAADTAPPPSVAQAYGHLGFAQQIGPERPINFVKVILTNDASSIIGMSGNSYLAEIDDGRRIVWMAPEDAQSMIGSPFADQDLQRANADLLNRLRAMSTLR